MMVELANMVKGRCLPRWWGSFLPVTSVSDETFLEMGDWDSMSKMYISMWSRASWHVYLCKARVWKDKSILDKVAAEQKMREVFGSGFHYTTWPKSPSLFILM